MGAILTQNTSWENAARAVKSLKTRGHLSARKILHLPPRRLSGLIRSSGYFNQKTRRLKVFVRYLCQRYGGRIQRMKRRSAIVLRKELLSLWGIGPETADSILLYAVEKPVFVVDAYTHRILARHSLIPWESSYEEIQRLLTQHLQRRTALFNEYHALLVALGKRFCHKSRPNCRECPIRTIGRLQMEKTTGKWQKRQRLTPLLSKD